MCDYKKKAGTLDGTWVCELEIHDGDKHYLVFKPRPLWYDYLMDWVIGFIIGGTFIACVMLPIILRWINNE